MQQAGDAQLLGATGVQILCLKDSYGSQNNNAKESTGLSAWH
jgi:hypothetical protein